MVIWTSSFYSKVYGTNKNPWILQLYLTWIIKTKTQVLSYSLVNYKNNTFQVINQLQLSVHFMILYDVHLVHISVSFLERRVCELLIFNIVWNFGVHKSGTTLNIK